LLPTPPGQEYGTRNNGKRGDGSLFKTAGAPSLSTMARQNLWPTIRSTDGERGGRGDLIQAVRGNANSHYRLWPTPHGFSKDGRSNGPSGNELGRAVNQKMCPSPAATDWKGSAKDGQRRGQLTDPALGVIPAGGSLNPTWVEWLMGWPLGWTDLNASETARCRCAPLRPGAS
jgi:hypothetical protein